MHHGVYVIRLDPAVLTSKKFREANPQYVPGLPCVYVGYTGLPIEERFAQHRRGFRSNGFVERHGRYLMRRPYERLNPMTEPAAAAREVLLAERLRRNGWAVWQK